MKTISNTLTCSFRSLALTTLFAGGLHAQSVVPGTEARCGFDTRHQHRLQTDGAYSRSVSAFNTRDHQTALALRDAGTLFVPVVVHVLESGGTNTEISDDLIRTGIRWLNERYRKVAGTAGAGAGVDTHIEFALAVRGPDDGCTNGITRHDLSGNSTYVTGGVEGDAGLTDDAVKAIGAWDQDRYYNIWLVNFIDDGSTAGYAYFASSHGDPWDGTVITVGTYSNPASSTLAHELGHALNLYHTFEGDVNGTTCPTNGTCLNEGDRVCDTPPHIRSAGDCNIAGTNACNGGSSNALFKTNYLDYSSGACRNMFTAGQDARIQSALTVDRASLLASNGNLSLVPPSAPLMDIAASMSLVCGVGQSVQFFDRSACIPNTYLRDPDLPGLSFTWTITNGTETHTPTEQNPVVVLNSTGNYSATLQVITGTGTYTRTENGIVLVTAAPVAACTPTSSNPSGNYGLTVSRVAFNTINNTTSASTNFPYTNYACSQNTVVAPGQVYPLSVTLNGTSDNTQIFRAYIDWNNNGTFEDPSELVGNGSQGNGQGTTTVNVTIPATPTMNTLLRMRVYGEAGSLLATERNCTAALFVGDVEDYGVYVSPSLARVSIAAAPSSTITYGTNVTFTPTAVNGGASPTYQWFRNGTPVAGGTTYSTNDLMPGETVHCSMSSSLVGVLASPALSNTVTMQVTGTPRTAFNADRQQVCVGTTVAFADASLLAPTSWTWSFPGGSPASSTTQHPLVTYNTPGTYSVTLTASNALGAGTTETKTAHINVHPTPVAVCNITRSSQPTAGIGITRVRLNTLDHQTPFDDAVLNDHTCSQSTTLTPGATYTIQVNVGSSNDQWVRVYIDYNRNGQFTESGELVFAPPTGRGLRTGSFTVPETPPHTNSLLRMRVISDFVNTTPGPCTSPLQYGQAEEFGVVVEAAPAINVAVKVALDGPYDHTTGLMNDGQRSSGLIPGTEPYTAMGYSFVGGGGETVAPSVLTNTGNDAIVDWVIVELRDHATPSTILGSRAALLQRDGDVVATNGVSTLSFPLPPATYRIAVKHRNHLGVMTLNGVALSSSATTVDLSASSTATYGTDARRTVTGAFPTQAMWAGDVDFNGAILYTGEDNDRDPILQRIGGTVPTSTVVGYHDTDVNLDGTTRYTGDGNDRDRVLSTIGGQIPTAIRQAQLP